MASRWFAAPSPLRVLPVELSCLNHEASSSVSQTHRAPGPPLVAKKRTSAKAKAASKEVHSLPPDRAQQMEEPLGRCRAVVEGRPCAVPYSLTDLDPAQAEDDPELLVVELRAPGGEDGWLDDHSLAGIYHPETRTVFSLSALRRLVQARVTLSGGSAPRSRSLRRALYSVCEPDSRNRLLVTLVTVADLASLPTVSGEDPPKKSS